MTPRLVLDHETTANGRRDCGGQQRARGRAGPQPAASARVMPVGLDRGEVRGHLLAGSGRALGGGRSRRPCLTGVVEPLGDLFSTLRELAQHGVRDAGDLGGVLVHRTPLDAERRGELAAHRRLEHRTTGAGGVVDRPPVQRRPATVDPLGKVGDEHVPVQVRIASPRCPMPVGGADEATRHHPSRAPRLTPRVAVLGLVRSPPHEARLALEPRQRLAERRVARGDDQMLYPPVGERVGDRHRLRHRERQVEPRHPSRMSAQRRPVRRQPGAGREPGEHRTKVSRLDLADQPERLDRRCQPTRPVPRPHPCSTRRVHSPPATGSRPRHPPGVSTRSAHRHMPLETRFCDAIRPDFFSWHICTPWVPGQRRRRRARRRRRRRHPQPRELRGRPNHRSGLPGARLGPDCCAAGG